jgi:hypothetical protein
MDEPKKLYDYDKLSERPFALGTEMHSAFTPTLLMNSVDVFLYHL